MTESRRGIVCIGASHQTASLAARERFALVGSKGRDLCTHLAEHPDVLEVAAVATCNRSELYIIAQDPETVAEAATKAFAELAEASPAELATMLVVREDDDAVEHLFRVAGGIESIVTGEAQIQGQLRDAHEAAQDAGTCGPVLDRLFRLAVEVGKRARTETTIGDGRASIGSIAAELVATRVGNLDTARMVVVGAGKMGGLAARSLAHRGVQRIDIVNRNEARAERVAASIGGGVGVGFDQLHAELVQSDAVVSSTNATHLVLRRDMIEAVMAERPDRPLVLVDLAVPRDVDADCAQIPNVHVFDLDDLERVVAETLHVRTDAVEGVERMALEGAAEFARWLRSLAATPAIRDMRDRAEALRASELERFLARMPHLTAADRQRIDQLTRGIVNRMLHEPTVRLREAAEQLS
ncbi:MAG: glutamyl-tRNA reductase [Thermoleophilia bacterium]|nr:glutamyl-tRNA reductase [Thermoleophilia bacterium]MCZ4497415.1 glutamyl-tRNA reductase [Thermoleophilia bacterium]